MNGSLRSPANAVDDLRVAASAERGGDERLRLATSEQAPSRAYAAARRSSDRDRTHRLQVAAVDTRRLVFSTSPRMMSISRFANS